MNQITQSRIQTYKPSVNRRPRTIERLRNNDRLEAWRWYKGIVGPFFRDWGWWKFSVFFVYFCTLDYRLFGKVKRGIKKLGLTMNIYNLFIQRRVYEKRIWGIRKLTCLSLECGQSSTTQRLFPLHIFHLTWSISKYLLLLIWWGVLWADTSGFCTYKFWVF